MRRRILFALLWMAALHPSAAAGALGHIESDAPVELFGTATAGGAHVEIFHAAFADGTLSGTVYAGQLVDRHRHTDFCSGSGPREYEHHHVLLNATAASPIRFQVKTNSLTVVDLGSESDVPLGNVEATAADQEGGEPAGLLAPNPYPIYTQQEAPPENTSMHIWGRAFPTSTFIAIPSMDVRMPFAGTVLLEVGNLSAEQAGASRAYRSETTRESGSCPAPVNPTGAPMDFFQLYHSVRLEVSTGTLTIKQSDLLQARAFYAGDHTPSSDVESEREYEAAPRGYWPKTEGASLREAYADYALPATLVSGTDLFGATEGVAVFRTAQGTVSEFEGDRDIDEERLALSGNLELTPSQFSEEGRRMKTELGGSIFSVDAAPAASTPEWTTYAAGAMGGAILFGVAFYAWPSAKWNLFKWFLLPLYARLRKDDILENPLRDNILHTVQEEPGISASELGRRLECGWGTLVYHLTVLERMRLVSSAREGRHKRFFAQGRINYSDKGAVGLLANPAAKTILDAIRGSPGLIQKDLSERLQLSPGTVAWHVERLATEGLVLKEEFGRTVRYYPSDRLLELTRQLAA